MKQQNFFMFFLLFIAPSGFLLPGGAYSTKKCNFKLHFSIKIYAKESGTFCLIAKMQFKIAIYKNQYYNSRF